MDKLEQLVNYLKVACSTEVLLPQRGILHHKIVDHNFQTSIITLLRNISMIPEDVLISRTHAQLMASGVCGAHLHRVRRIVGAASSSGHELVPNLLPRVEENCA